VRPMPGGRCGAADAAARPALRMGAQTVGWAAWRGRAVAVPAVAIHGGAAASAPGQGACAVAWAAARVGARTRDVGGKQRHAVRRRAATRPAPPVRPAAIRRRGSAPRRAARSRRPPARTAVPCRAAATRWRRRRNGSVGGGGGGGDAHAGRRRRPCGAAAGARCRRPVVVRRRARAPRRRARGAAAVGRRPRRPRGVPVVGRCRATAAADRRSPRPLHAGLGRLGAACPVFCVIFFCFATVGMCLRVACVSRKPRRPRPARPLVVLFTVIPPFSTAAGAVPRPCPFGGRPFQRHAEGGTRCGNPAAAHARAPAAAVATPRSRRRRRRRRPHRTGRREQFGHFVLDGYGDNFNGSQNCPDQRGLRVPFITLYETRGQRAQTAATPIGGAPQWSPQPLPAHPWACCQIGSGLNHEPLELWGSTTRLGRPLSAGLTRSKTAPLLAKRSQLEKPASSQTGGPPPNCPACGSGSP